MNGHQITDSYHRSPEFRRKHCSKCGAETIHQCQACGFDIRGDYHVEGVFAVGFRTPVPTHCENCGKPFPWLEKKKQLAEAVDTTVDGFKLLEHICSRFHLVAKQLRTRSEERRVGKECRSPWAPDHLQSTAVIMYWCVACTYVFFFSSRRRHTRFSRDWSSDVCSSDLVPTHCENCGKPFPWLEKKKQLAEAVDTTVDGFKLLEHICSRFHLVAKQLRT